jgi:hypothetical protein
MWSRALPYIFQANRFFLGETLEIRRPIPSARSVPPTHRAADFPRCFSRVPTLLFLRSHMFFALAAWHICCFPRASCRHAFASFLSVPMVYMSLSPHNFSWKCTVPRSCCTQSSAAGFLTCWRVRHRPTHILCGHTLLLILFYVLSLSTFIRPCKK